jgi:hypothetical protein
MHQYAEMVALIALAACLVWLGAVGARPSATTGRLLIELFVILAVALLLPLLILAAVSLLG